jgi:hypothetical protein
MYILLQKILRLERFAPTMNLQYDIFLLVNQTFGGERVGGTVVVPLRDHDTPRACPAVQTDLKYKKLHNN